MRCVSSLLAIVVLVALSGCTARDDATEVLASAVDEGWPTLFGPHQDSISREGAVRVDWPATGPRLAWRCDVGSGYSAPVALDGLVVLFDRQQNEEVLTGLDLETGQARWRFAYPTGYQCRYQYSSGPYSTPVLDEQHVYAMGAEGRFHCLLRATGQLVWSRHLHAEFDVDEGLFGAGASPLVDQGRIILNLGGARRGAGIVALDAQTGDTLWQATSERASYATPRAATIHGQRLIFALTDEQFVALEAETGRVLWQTPFKSKAPDSCNATSPLVVGDRVLVTTGPGWGALCLRVLPDGRYEELWRDRRVLDSTWSNLIHVDGYVYGFSSKRVRASLRCVELETGKLAWSHESALERGTLLGVGRRLIGWGEHGHLAAVDVDPRRCVVRAMTDEPLLATPCYSAPALHRGRLLVRNERQLACFDLRSDPSLAGAALPGPNVVGDR